MDNSSKGACLCGAVSFLTRGPLRGVVYCHCTQCRKQSGHYYAATSVDDGQLEIKGSENITWYAASGFARRGFCSRCGSLLFWKANSEPEISIMAGAFDEAVSLEGSCHIFVGQKGTYYEIDDGLPKYERSSPHLVVADE
ncbi:GFA family protein [Aminobacter sp. HY435]|uniref:GFA family protein n=1 Tax=Aminobacter sp. HY435 TaxID=2970917 RepID=UPI0022B98AC1|nr:GFA family protein [Aminobacter sp. HY435]